MQPHRSTAPPLVLDHYVGIDVGTGSARACIIDETGDIKGLASQPILLWQPDHGYYEQSTSNIWASICQSVKEALDESNIPPEKIKGIGFDATCSLAVFSHDTNEPVAVTKPKFDNFDGNDRNVILWLDHRPVEETKKINATKHKLLKYVGGTMSIEMEIPKILWLKNNMPKELFDRCKFYDLVDALTHMATGNETRNFCSTVCKQGYVPVGVDGSVKGWQEDFLTTIGLEDLVKDDFKRLGGVNGNGNYRSAGELVGVLSKKAANGLGLPEGIAVGAGVIDAYSGWIGTVGAKVELSPGELEADQLKNNFAQAFHRLAAVAGTSTCHLAMSKKAVFVPGVWGPYRDVVLPGFWMTEGGQSATGELLRHIIEIHPANVKAKKAHAKARSKDIYEFLNAYLENMREKSGAPSISYLGRHFFLYGDLWGNRSPIADPNMKGAVVGLSSDKSIDNLALWYYGAMEFIAMQTRQIIEAMNMAGHELKTIFMSGSQCQNPLLMSLIASICDMPVVLPEYANAAVVHGAAMLGAKAATAAADGSTEDLWSIMDRMSKPGRLVKPGPLKGEKFLFDAKYEVFLQQSRSQRDYRRLVDAAVHWWLKH